ncbi:diguanylate cyclase [Alteromonas sp. 5E99-2]|uniref:diguanylate cyclase n=1 Tax=Alteromonas sp. 5E99-2 TaxID=2817683 RepID=UPI001A98C2E9|nr:diguanylate cyclase [Alteromonas sp. 5E99-2]MBO1255887.1 diguanylate cyclase [Alteromonas sp. 5E99-2]
MQHDVLIVESHPRTATILARLVEQAGLNPIRAYSLHDAKNTYFDGVPEALLCVLASHMQVDASPFEAIDFFTSMSMPTIALSASMQSDIRKHVLQYDIVDYIGLENAQTADYLQRLLQRLNKNKHIGVILQSNSNKTVSMTNPLLQRHGFKGYISQSEQQTQKLLADNPEIQLIMLDADCENDLSEFIADIRKGSPKDELAIVGISYKPSDFTAAHFIKCGATDFFNLPFGHEEFLLKIMQMLEAIEHVAVIRQTANQDYLTGLPNRRHFFYAINKLPAIKKQRQALALIDLDHFKNINDTYGHDAGDAVLKHIANILLTSFSHAQIARFGGEEFCVYLNDMENDDAVTEIERLRKTIEQSHIKWNNDKLFITASIGVAFGAQLEVETLLSAADDLLYKVKREGRNRVYCTN